MFRIIFYFLKSLLININFSKIKVSLSARIRNKKTFDGYNKIGKKTYIKGHLGKYSYVGQYCDIYGEIGRFCSISNNVKCVVGKHPLTYVSTSPSFYSKAKSNNISFCNKDFYDGIEEGVTIGNDVWIGENVLIKGGVKIGDGAVIAMGSVVVKDVEPFSIVGGNPAKLIKFRFDEETIKRIKQSEWWNNDNAYFEAHYKEFLQPETFNKEQTK